MFFLMTIVHWPTSVLDLIVQKGTVFAFQCGRITNNNTTRLIVKVRLSFGKLSWWPSRMSAEIDESWSPALNSDLVTHFAQLWSGAFVNCHVQVLPFEKSFRSFIRPSCHVWYFCIIGFSRVFYFSIKRGYLVFLNCSVSWGFWNGDTWNVS
jgi:hypothetical protein